MSPVLNNIKLDSFSCLQISSAIQTNKLMAITLHFILSHENLKSTEQD